MCSLERVSEPGERAVLIARFLEAQRGAVSRQGVRQVPPCAEGKVTGEGVGPGRTASTCQQVRTAGS